MAFHQITNAEREGRGVSGLPNTPNLTPSQLQERFDSLGNLALDRLSELIDALNKETAAGNIGSANGTVQTDLAELHQKLSAVLQRLTGLEIQTGVGGGEAGTNSTEFKGLVESVNEIKGNLQIVKKTLTAGETLVTIENERITTDSTLSFYSSVYGVNPETVAVTDGVVTLTFEAQETDVEVGVRIDG